MGLLINILNNNYTMKQINRIATIFASIMVSAWIGGISYLIFNYISMHQV